MTVTVRAQTRHVCARCQHASRRDQLIRSNPTASYYCRDFHACDRRHARNAARDMAAV